MLGSGFESILKYSVVMKFFKRLKRAAKIVVERLAPPVREGIEHYDKAIPAEVLEDDFYLSLQSLASDDSIRTILEIGSSSGEGSTKALTAGILDRTSATGVELHCLEISSIRFNNLKEHYSALEFVKVHRMSSVGMNSFPTFKELKRFYRSTPSILNNYTYDEVASWLQKDIEYLAQNFKELSSSIGEIDIFGIDWVRREYDIEDFDLVVIDGGEFLGWAEYSLLKGANWICLDDINSFKCRRAYDDLISGKSYSLVQENWQTRNGWAIFRKK